MPRERIITGVTIYSNNTLHPGLIIKVGFESDIGSLNDVIRANEECYASSKLISRPLITLNCNEPINGRVMTFMTLQGLFIEDMVFHFSSHDMKKKFYNVTVSSGSPSLAFDGTVTNDINQIYQSTIQDPSPWMMVNLGKSNLIIQKLILHLPEVLMLNLSRHTLWIKQNQGDPYKFCTSSKEATLHQNYLIFKCKRPIFGRYIHIESEGQLLIGELDIIFVPPTIFSKWTHSASKPLKAVRNDIEFVLDGKINQVYNTATGNIEYDRHQWFIIDMNTQFLSVKNVKVHWDIFNNSKSFKSNYLIVLAGDDRITSRHIFPTSKNMLCGEKQDVDAYFYEFDCRKAPRGQYIILASATYSVVHQHELHISEVDISVNPVPPVTPLLRDCSRLFEAGYTMDNVFPIDVTGQENIYSLIDAQCYQGWTIILTRGHPSPDIEVLQLQHMVPNIGFGEGERSWSSSNVPHHFYNIT